MAVRTQVSVIVVLLVFMYSVFFILYIGLLKPPLHITLQLPPDIVTTEHVKSFPNAPIPGQRNIFFVETSCALLDVPGMSSEVKMTNESGGLHLTPRTACALEAAARANPLRPVFLAHTCPVDFERMWATAPEYIQQLFSLPNFRVWPVRLSDLFANASLESLLTKEKLGKSKWPPRHASNFLRLVLLWHFGGTYLDLDMLLLRSLEDMKNFACAESEKWVNNAVLDFANDRTGREVANASIRLTREYRPDVPFPGPRLLTRLVLERCGKTKFPRRGTAEDCNGFRVLPTIAFYPMHYTKWRRFFSDENAKGTMNEMRNSTAAHLWSTKSSRTINVPITSNQPLAQIARRICPGVAATSGGKI